MNHDGQAAEKLRPVTAKRQSAKPSGGAKRQSTKSVRCQLHLGAETVKRLGVHCSLVGQNNSKVADAILMSYLARFGQGREIFPPPALGDSTDEVES